MASKATVQRQKSSEKVVASGRTNMGIIASSIENRYGAPAGQGAKALIEAVVTDLESKTTDMIRSDNAHEEELRDDPEVRTTRDDTSEALHDKLVESREQMTTFYGDAYAAKVGFSGKTPFDPVEVLRLGQTVVGNLGKVQAPTSKIKGLEITPEIWTTPLGELVAELDGLTAKVALEEREAEATLAAKHAAIDAYDAEFSDTANLLGALLRISGEKELAKRVRPSMRRRGRTVEDAGDTEPSDAE